MDNPRPPGVARPIPQYNSQLQAIRDLVNNSTPSHRGRGSTPISTLESHLQHYLRQSRVDNPQFHCDQQHQAWAEASVWSWYGPSNNNGQAIEFPGELIWPQPQQPPQQLQQAPPQSRQQLQQAPPQPPPQEQARRPQVPPQSPGVQRTQPNTQTIQAPSASPSGQIHPANSSDAQQFTFGQPKPGLSPPANNRTDFRILAAQYKSPSPMDLYRAHLANAAMQPQNDTQIVLRTGRPETANNGEAHKIKTTLLQQFRDRPTFVVPPGYNTTIWDNNTGMPRGAVVNKGKNRHTAMSGLNNNFWEGMLVILGPKVLEYITPRFWSMGMDGEQFDFSLTWCDWNVTIPDDDAREVRQFFELFLQRYADWAKNNQRLDNTIPIDNALMYHYSKATTRGNSKFLRFLATPEEISRGYERLYPGGRGRIFDGLYGLPGFPARRLNNSSKGSSRGRRSR